MNNRPIIPAVLLHYAAPTDAEPVRAETNASPFDCDSLFHAAGNLAAGKPALVLADDEEAVTAEAAWRAVGRE